MSKEAVFPEAGLNDRTLVYQHVVCVVVMVHQDNRRPLGYRRPMIGFVHFLVS